MKSSDGSWRSAAVLSVVLISLTLAGCSQHGVTTEETASTDQHLPFEGTSDKGGISPTGSLMPTAIPAGTPLAVHLRAPLSSSTSRSGDSFEAVLEEPIMVRGQSIAPRGAILTGKVLDARASGQFDDSGYMRLALTGISISGKSLPIQTSSIFVKRGSHDKRNAALIGRDSIGQVSIGQGSIGKGSIRQASTREPGAGQKDPLMGSAAGAAFATEKKDVGVATERRLTFRLAQPLPLEF